jgi:hypothetical protein
VDLLARSGHLHERIQAKALARWQKTNSQYQYKLGFADDEDRLLLKEIPEADYSRGGVGFFGASNVRASIMVWALPADQRRLIHNYGLSSATYSQQFQFIRLLVEHEGLLAAGGDKTLIVLGLFYANAVIIENRPTRQYFPALFRRHGLYTYDPREGIQPVAMNPLRRFLLVEKARCGGLLNYDLDPVTHVMPPGRHEPAKYQQYWTDYMGADWQQDLPRELDQLGRLIDYLHARGASVAAVSTPLGSWHRQLPYPAAFARQVAPLLAAKAVPVIDLTDLLADEEFNDSAHANYLGRQKLHAAMLDIALPFLRRTGALP